MVGRRLVFYVNEFLGGQITAHRTLEAAKSEWIAHSHATTFQATTTRIMAKGSLISSETEKTNMSSDTEKSESKCFHIYEQMPDKTGQCFECGKIISEQELERLYKNMDLFCG